MPLNTLRELLVQQVDELDVSAKRAREVYPRLAKAAHDTDLARMLRQRTEQKREQILRLERILDELDVTPQLNATKATRGLVEDCIRLAESVKAVTHVRDAAIIAAAQHVIHDEIAGCGCAKTWASLLGLDKAAAHLGLNLDEEHQADRELTMIADRLNRNAIAPVAV